MVLDKHTGNTVAGWHPHSTHGGRSCASPRGSERGACGKERHWPVRFRVATASALAVGLGRPASRCVWLSHTCFRVWGWDPVLQVCTRSAWRCAQGPSVSRSAWPGLPTQGHRLARAGLGWGPSGTVLLTRQVCRPAGETDGVSAPLWNKPRVKIIARVEIRIPEVCSQDRGCFNYRGNSLEPRRKGRRLIEKHSPRCLGRGMPGRRWRSCSEFSARSPARLTWPSVPHAVRGKCQQTTSLGAGLWLRARVYCTN